jgi:hypothetical protein
MLVYLLAERGQKTAVNDDLPQAVAGLVGACVLVIAALWLERACRVPPGPSNGGPSQPGGAGDRTAEGRQDGDRSAGG